MTTLPDEFDSIFRYIEVASQRAEQLVRGALPRIESPKRKTLLALEEVDEGMVPWRILTAEEIQAQHEARLDRYNQEIDVTNVPHSPVQDVLPTKDSAEDDKVGELARLERLFGLATAAPAEAETEETEAPSSDALGALDLDD